MKFCNKCHRRVLTTETFVGPRNYVWESGNFCHCNIQVVGNDDGPKAVVQPSSGRGGSALKNFYAKKV